MSSHPETKQDLWVLKHFPLAGSFCELGAFDGLTHSNTLMLEGYGWRGVLIEAWPKFAQQCLKNRPKAVTYQALIGRGPMADFVVGGQYSGIYSEMPREWQQEHDRRKNPMCIMTPKRLSEFVLDCDYLSVDTEGNEYSILQDWLRDGGRAEAVTVEFRYDAALMRRLKWLMEDYGYVLDDVRGFDLCFLRK